MARRVGPPTPRGRPPHASRARSSPGGVEWRVLREEALGGVMPNWRHLIAMNLALKLAGSSGWAGARHQAEVVLPTHPKPGPTRPGPAPLCKREVARSVEEGPLARYANDPPCERTGPSGPPGSCRGGPTARAWSSRGGAPCVGTSPGHGQAAVTTRTRVAAGAAFGSGLTRRRRVEPNAAFCRRDPEATGLPRRWAWRGSRA